MVFSGSHNYLEVLDEYIDTEILPAAMYPEGKGEAIDGMPNRFDGGLIPNNSETSHD